MPICLMRSPSSRSCLTWQRLRWKICDFFGGKQRGLTNIENNCWASTCSTKRHVFSILSKKSRSMLVRQFSTHTSMTWVYLPFETLRGRGFVWEKVLSIQRIGKWNSQWYKTAFLARSCGRLHFCLKRESTWDDVVGYTCIQICSWGWTRSYLVGGGWWWFTRKPLTRCPSQIWWTLKEARRRHLTGQSKIMQDM